MEAHEKVLSQGKLGMAGDSEKVSRAGAQTWAGIALCRAPESGKTQILGVFADQAAKKDQYFPYCYLVVYKFGPSESSGLHNPSLCEMKSTTLRWLANVKPGRHAVDLVWWNLAELIFMPLFPLYLSCKCPLLGKVWEADLEACRLLIQSLQLQEARGSWSAEEERQTDDLGEAACTVSPVISPWPHAEDERKTPLQAFEEWKAHLDPAPHGTGSEQVRAVHPVASAGPPSQWQQTILGGLPTHPYKLLKVFIALECDYKIM